jgi:hypothetical protein
LIAYGAFRFLSEYLRPEPTWAWSLTFYQWAALTLTLTMLVQWIIEWRVRRFA